MDIALLAPQFSNLGPGLAASEFQAVFPARSALYSRFESLPA
jgi:hypothetical protein